MNEIRLVVCDIDNTLIPEGADDISDNMKSAFHTLQARGISVLVATGRHYNFIQEKLFDSIRGDTIVTINGACLNDSQGKVLSYDTIPLEVLQKLVGLCERHGIGLGLKFPDNIVTYVNHELFVEGYLPEGALRDSIINDSLKQSYHTTHTLPCGIFLIGEEAVIEGFSGEITELVFAHSFHNGYDVFLRDVNKASGVEKYLRLHQLSWDACIAFGDAENDIAMLKKARIGVTFENAKESVKAAADYISVPCREDGVYHALRHFQLI